MPGDFFFIGRGAGNDMVVGNPYVSGRHCRLVRSGGGFLLEDLGSSGGTFVNGARVSRQNVTFGDRIELSSHYRLDWNDHRLRSWMMAGSRAVSPGYGGGNFRQGSTSFRGKVSEIPAWLLTVVGSFFFLFYLIPIADGAFLWDALDNNFSDGMAFLFLAMAGIAVPIIAYTSQGTGRAASLASIGFAGCVLYLVSAGGDLPSSESAGLLLSVLPLVLLWGMMSMNNVVISFPRNRRMRLLAGIFASVYIALITVVQIWLYIEADELRSDSVAFILVFSTLGYLANMAVSILLTTNIKASSGNRSTAELAQTIMMYSMCAQMIFASILSVLAYPHGQGGWLFFLAFRMFGFIFGLGILLAGGVADLIKLNSNGGGYR